MIKLAAIFLFFSVWLNCFAARTYFETEKGVVIDNALFILNDSGKFSFYDSEIIIPKSLKDLITASVNTFDNTINGFAATNVQAAIEEARNTALGSVMFVVSIVRNGTMSNGDWIGRSELAPNTPSYVVPRNMKFMGIGWGNSSSNADFDLEFYKNGRATTKFRTYQARNLTYGYNYGWTDLLNAGDILDVKYIDQGDNASDFAIDLIFMGV